METDEKPEVQAVESSTTGNMMQGGSSPDPLASMSDESRSEWLLTGKLPGAEPEKKPAAAASSADGDKTKTAADGKKAESSTAPATASEGDAKTKPAESSTVETAPKDDRQAKARILELNSDKKILLARIAELEAGKKTPEKAPAETAAAEKPAPKMEDFETLEEYVEKSIEYGVDRKLTAERKAREVADQTAQQRERETAAHKMLDDTMKIGKTKHADFDAVFTDDVPIIEGSTLDRWLMSEGMTNELRADVMYHFGSHRDELTALNKLSPSQAVRELVKLEISLSGSATPTKADETKPASAGKEKPVSKAPAPGSEVGSHGTPTEDPRAKALASGDVSSYMELENRRELAKTSRR